MDSQFIGSVINALPLEHMIGGPLQAMIKAQVQASKAYTDFLLSVCIKDGKAVAIEFDYDETVVDEQGVNKGSVTRKMSIPLPGGCHPPHHLHRGRHHRLRAGSEPERSQFQQHRSGGFRGSVHRLGRFQSENDRQGLP